MRPRILLVLSTLLMLAALFMVFVYVPADKDQGNIQRIFYFHVPVAWVAFLAFFVTFIAGIAYLAKRNPFWDMVASASAETGLVFTTLILITGSIWGHVYWGKWWVWDPRLTSSLALWLIYVSYFMIRSYISDEDRKARFAAVVGIIGFVDVPIVGLAIQLRSQHPSALIFEGGLAGSMLATLLVSIAAFTSLYLLFVAVRVHLKEDERELKSLKEAMKE